MTPPSAEGRGQVSPAAIPVTDYARATWEPSPNYWAGRSGQAVTHIVVHGTAGLMPGPLAWFTTPASQVSAHYLVTRAGRVYQCVRESDSAWANGVVSPASQYVGRANPNLWTISIEHERDLHNLSAITGPQLQASTLLARDIARRHGRLTVIGHDAIAVGRVCPGPDFPSAALQGAVDSAASEGRMDHVITPPPEVVSQFDPRTVDGRPTENGPLNCGPGCVATVEQFVLGWHEDPDHIKDTILGQDATGYTYMWQLQNHLKERGVETLYYPVSDPASALTLLDTWLTRGQPAIVLFYFDIPAQTGGHFCLCTGVSADGGVLRANPWTGSIETLDRATWQQGYQGGMLRVLSPRYQPPGPPLYPRLRITTPQFLRALPRDDSARGYLMIPTWQAIRTGAWTPHWTRVVDLTGRHQGWLRNDHARIDGVAPLPSGVTPD